MILVLVLFSGGPVESKEPAPSSFEVQASADPFPFPIQGLAWVDAKEFSERKGALLRLKSARGGEGLELLASAVLREGERALAEGKMDRASELGALASELCPNLPTPHFFLARVIASHDQNKIVGILQEYLAGWLETSGHFWFLFFALESLIYLALIAFIATVATVIVLTTFFYSPLFFHEWRERSGGVLREWALIPLVVWILFVLPLWSRGLFWGLIVCTILFWSFYSYKERLLVGSFVVLVGFSFLFLPYIVSFRAAKASPLLNLMVKNQRGEATTFVPDAEKILREDPGSWTAYFTLGGVAMSRADYSAALNFYGKALAANSGSALILNNIGNAYFYLKSYDRAIESYQAASKIDPKRIEPAYNLSQAYREKLLFEGAQKQYRDARELDEKAVEVYTRFTAENPDHPVVQARLGAVDLWRKAIDPEQGADESMVLWAALFGPVSLKAAPFLAIIWGSILFVRTASKRLKRRAIRCESCRKVICFQCQKIIFDFKVCAICWSELKTISKRSEVAPRLRSANQSDKTGLVLALLPGGGHLYHRETLKGAVLLSVFFLAVGYYYWGGVFHPNLMWRMDDQKEIAVPLVLGLLYLASLLGVWRAHLGRGR